MKATTLWAPGLWKNRRPGHTGGQAELDTETKRILSYGETADAVAFAAPVGSRHFDEYRFGMLPHELQLRLFSMLVDRRRPARLKDKVMPCTQYFYSGIVRHGDKLMHRLPIQSKVVGAEGDAMFETRALSSMTRAKALSS